MNDPIDDDDDDDGIEPAPREISSAAPTWWLAALGDTLIWARLQVRDSGIAEVFDSDGRTLLYDDEGAARMALLDAEFVAFDGLDDDDAARLGFELEEIEPPRGDSDEALLPQMIARI